MSVTSCLEFSSHDSFSFFIQVCVQIFPDHCVLKYITSTPKIFYALMQLNFFGNTTCHNIYLFLFAYCLFACQKVSFLGFGTVSSKSRTGLEHRRHSMHAFWMNKRSVYLYNCLLFICLPYQTVISVKREECVLCLPVIGHLRLVAGTWYVLSKYLLNEWVKRVKAKVVEVYRKQLETICRTWREVVAFLALSQFILI